MVAQQLTQIAQPKGVDALDRLIDSEYYPESALLLNGQIDIWLLSRNELLQAKGRDTYTGVEASKIVSFVPMVGAALLNAVNPLAMPALGLSVAAYLLQLYKERELTGEIYPAPFLRRNAKEIMKLSSADLRRNLAPRSSAEFFNTYLSEAEQWELQLLQLNHDDLARSLASVQHREARFWVYRYLVTQLKSRLDRGIFDPAHLNQVVAERYPADRTQPVAAPLHQAQSATAALPQAQTKPTATVSPLAQAIAQVTGPVLAPVSDFLNPELILQQIAAGEIALPPIAQRTADKDCIQLLAEYMGHVIMACRTQSGKTSTILGTMARKRELGQQVGISVIDPKNSHWLGLEHEKFGDGRSRLVRISLANGRSLEKVIDHLEYIERIQAKRQSQRLAAYESGQDYNPPIEIVAIDELPATLITAQQYDQYCAAMAKQDPEFHYEPIHPRIIGKISTLLLTAAEDRIYLWLVAQSHRVGLLGLSDGLRAQTAVWAQGRLGEYASIEAALSDSWLIPMGRTRKQLQGEFEQLRDTSDLSQPIFYTSLGGHRLGVVPNLEGVKKQRLFNQPEPVAVEAEVEAAPQEERSPSRYFAAVVKVAPERNENAGKTSPAEYEQLTSAWEAVAASSQITAGEKRMLRANALAIQEQRGASDAIKMLQSARAFYEKDFSGPNTPPEPEPANPQPIPPAPLSAEESQLRAIQAMFASGMLGDSAQSAFSATIAEQQKQITVLSQKLAALQAQAEAEADEEEIFAEASQNVPNLFAAALGTAAPLDATETVSVHQIIRGYFERLEQDEKAESAAKKRRPNPVSVTPRKLHRKWKSRFQNSAAARDALIDFAQSNSGEFKLVSNENGHCKIVRRGKK